MSTPIVHQPAPVARTVPRVVVHRKVSTKPLVPALPGGALVDLFELPSLRSAAVAGFFRNYGTEPPFEVPSYPTDEFKYVTEGHLAIEQDGAKLEATVGDLVFIPAGSRFVILPTAFTAVYFTARPTEYTIEQAEAAQQTSKVKL
ncbi:hypothetical protein JCM10908_005932 [Rhodotorula pacifica]|uniref:uncharacterized protein n=1 Tax=Rhodotorula pacifica TaxID=1495444 RepID=UPI00318184D6